MTTIEQLAKEFSKGNLATETAFLAGAKQAILLGAEAIRKCSQYQTIPHVVLYENGYEEALEDAEFKLKELL